MPRKKKRTTSTEESPASLASTSSQTSKESSYEKSPPQTPENHDISGKDSFHVVGIGASAGGLEAFGQFLANLPPDSGMAYVLVQHLDPDHESCLPDLLMKYTRMQIFQVEDGMPVEPNCVYVIPPNHDLTIMQGVLYLLEPAAPRSLRLPIDFFFRALAQDRQAAAIGIVLSGTASDGTSGLKAIKQAGGLVMVQEPQSAQYDGMPRSAIATGLADYILPPDKMPEHLLAYLRYPAAQTAEQNVTLTTALPKIFALLRARTGHDFSHYKKTTIIRRLERRMAVNRIDSLAAYLRYLRENAAEAQTLFKECLIGVSNFFRDPDAFEALKQKVLPTLFERASHEQLLRIWVPGCATGEEAYSLAMLLQEQMESLQQWYAIQIFATDLDAEAIEIARQGMYPENILTDVPPQYVQRFFTKKHTTYQVKHELRDMLVFAEQSLIQDPPFSNLDLISCRNLLIYFEPELQQKAFALFHYSLNQDGCLMLGTSESVGQADDLFTTLDKKWKLYQRQSGASTRLPVLDFAAGSATPASTQAHATGHVRPETPPSLRDVAEKRLLESYAATCVIISKQHDMLYVHGRTGKYLETTTGSVNVNIVNVARAGLKFELVAAIRQAMTQQQEIRVHGVRVKTNGGEQAINLIVTPLLEPPALSGLLTIVIEDVAPPTLIETVQRSDLPDAAKHLVAKLEQEVRSTKEYLQTSVEELETTNEELKSTNEELQSANEELQSANEELRTSQEELRSVNEELLTANTELNARTGELTRSNNDLNNLIANTEVGIIFVDLNLCVQRFTPAATEVMNLLESDIGRPLSHVVSKLEYEPLVADVKAVVDTLIPKESDVRTKAGEWCALRIMPYRTIENVPEGAVLTFSTLPDQRRKLEQIRRLASVVQDSNDAVTMQDREGTILTWNRGAEALYGYSEAEALAMNIRDIVPADQSAEALEMVRQIFRGELVTSFETQRRTKDGRILEVWMTVTVLIDDAGQPTAVATTERDVTARNQAQEHLRRLAAVVQDSNDAVTMQDREGTILTWNRGAEALYGYSEAEALAMNIRDIVPADQGAEALEMVRQIFRGEFITSFETQRRTKDGRILDVWLTVTVLTDDAGQPTAVATTERDISERRQMKEEYTHTIGALQQELEELKQKNRKED
ncbi:MAG: PAS domain S-box protein [bacterium]|nr:PAS domain S-box protein [bacterium]